MTKFVAEITVGKRDRLVTLRIPAGNTIAPSLRQVSVTFDGETSHHHREPISGCSARRATSGTRSSLRGS